MKKISLSIFDRDEVFKPFVLFGMVVLSLTLGILIPTKAQASNWFRATGFYWIFSVFIFWLLAIPWDDLKLEKLKNHFLKHWFALVLAIVLTICAFMVSTPKHRVLADETNLLGIASSMYDFHSCFNPTETLYYYDGIIQVLNKEWDIRPIFFPFLVYLAHSIRGYDPNNCFLVNGLAGVCLFLFFYLLISRWFSVTIGLLGMLFLAAFPVLILWITSGGFEVVNLFFILLSFFAFDLFISTREIKYAEFMCFTILLSANVRYESIVFGFPLLLLAVWNTPREEWGKLSPRMFIFPILFVPMVWHRMMLNPRDYLLPGTNELFSFNNLITHIQPNLQYFLGLKTNYGMIPFFFWSFVLSSLILISWIVWNFKDISSNGKTLGLASFIGVVSYAIVLSSYYMGNLTHQWTIRLGIAFLPYFLFPTIWAIAWLSKNGELYKKWFFTLAIALICFHWPYAGANGAVREIVRFREFSRVCEFLKDNYPRKDVLVVSDYSNLYVPLRYSSVKFYNIRKRTGVFQNIKSGLFRDTIGVQIVSYQTKKPTPETDFGELFSGKTLYEIQLSGEHFLRIVRLEPLEGKKTTQ